MPRRALLSIVCCAAIVGLHSLERVIAQDAVQPVNDLPNPYRTIANWGTMPAGRTWGSTSAIERDPDGRSIWVADRCSANSCDGSNLPPLLKFDSSGQLVSAFGERMFVFPHGIHIDAEGNIWIADAQGSKDDKKGHQVVKFNRAGKVLMTLGKAGVAGNPPEALTQPCDIVTAPNGDIFVAEGHGGQNPEAPPNTVARISKFSKDGKFLKSWGRLGLAAGEFRTPHALAFDSRGRLFVADRGNNRLQIFDQDGQFLDEWTQFSRVSGLFIDRDDTLYAIDSESSATTHPGWKKGVRIGSAKDGKVAFFVPGHQTERPEGAAGEGVTVDVDGNVYAAEVTIRGVTKYVRNP